MPTSYIDPIPLVIKTVEYYKPKTVLDIGCGFGKYGFLLRDQLDVLNEQKGPNVPNYSINRSSWKTQIDAIEVYEKYICDLQRYIYTNIFIGNIIDLVKNLNNYDVILLLDVIEHFEKEEGRRLLDNLMSKVNKLLVITTPPFEFTQGNICGNEFERHRSVWAPGDFKKYKNKRIINVNNYSLCIFLSREPGKIPLLNQKNRIHFARRIKYMLWTILGERKGTKLIEVIRKIKH
jgi:hypothetical protein